MLVIDRYSTSRDILEDALGEAYSINNRDSAGVDKVKNYNFKYIYRFLNNCL